MGSYTIRYERDGWGWWVATVECVAVRRRPTLDEARRSIRAVLARCKDDDRIPGGPIIREEGLEDGSALSAVIEIDVASRPIRTKRDARALRVAGRGEALAGGAARSSRTIRTRTS